MYCIVTHNMKNNKHLILLLFFLQILLVKWGAIVFSIEVNPFVLLIVTGLLVWFGFKSLSASNTDIGLSSKPTYYPWLHAFVGIFGIFTAYEELRKLWLKYPDPGRSSDVIPQLKAQCDWFFSGQFPYQPVTELSHAPFPVYMPLHWLPVQISNVLQIDVRWSAIIMLGLAVGMAGYALSKSHPSASLQRSLSGMLLLALPLWAYIIWDEIDIVVSLEGIVAAWYILLAAGLASKNHTLIIIGLIGALMSRYTLMFWTLPFMALLWLNAPKKLSYLIWGTVALAILFIFVIPFWMKDPSIVSKILAYYNSCADDSWLRPDEYTFKEGLSLNIHLRHWLPGTPEENQGIRNLPQIIVQLLLGGFGVYYYQKKWKEHLDFYSFSLVLLTIMTLSLYSFSPMLFRYYLLMPLSVSAVLCWKVLVDSKKGI